MTDPGEAYLTHAGDAAAEIAQLRRQCNDLQQQVEQLQTRNFQLQREVDEGVEWENSVATRVPDGYDDDCAQTAIIDRWLDDVVAAAAALGRVAAWLDYREHQSIKSVEPLPVEPWVHQLRKIAGLPGGQVAPAHSAEWGVRYPAPIDEHIVGYVDEDAAYAAMQQGRGHLMHRSPSDWVEVAAAVDEPVAPPLIVAKFERLRLALEGDQRMGEPVNMVAAAIETDGMSCHHRGNGACPTCLAIIAIDRLREYRDDTLTELAEAD